MLWINYRWACLTFQFVEELIDLNQMNKAFKAMTLKVNFVILALPEKRFLDFGNSQAVIFLVNFDIFLSFVSLFWFRVKYTFD